MDIYEKIKFNLNIIKNNILDLHKINFSKMILLKNNFDSEDSKGIPYYCQNNIDIPFIIKIFPKNEANSLLLNTEIVYSNLFSQELIYNSPNFISVYDYHYHVSNNTNKFLFKLPLKYEFSDILLYEFISEKDLDTFYFNNNNDIPINVWKSIVFQVIYNLYLLQDKYKFMHNDLHPANILIDSVQKTDIINYNFNNNKFYVSTYGYLVKFSDFEFSCLYDKAYSNIKNSFISKIGYCKSYDLHTFLVGLLDLPELPITLIEFIKELYPSKLIDKKHLNNGTLTPDLIKKYKKELELLIPEKLIFHEFFKEYLISKKNHLSFNYKSNSI